MNEKLKEQVKLERQHRGYSNQKELTFNIPCPDCKGRGWFAMDMMAESTYDCGRCKGTGDIKDAFTP